MQNWRGVILDIMKHQSSLIGIGNLESNIRLGHLFVLLVCPYPSPVLGFSGAAMMVQSILENKRVGLSPVAVHCHHQELVGGGGGQAFYSKITNSNDSL